MSKLFANYFVASVFANSFLRFTDLWNAKVVRKNNNVTDILFGEKIMIISFAGLIGPYCLPYSIIKKIDKTQLYIQGKNANDYDIDERIRIEDYYFGKSFP